MKNRDGLFTVLRLYLIRHGETEANVQGIVVGNAESPLTVLGIEQAKSLGRSSSWLRDQHFHRVFCSDLERAKHTAALTLNEVSAASSKPCHDNGILSSIEYTDKLRELAKGARQGFPKIMSLDDAMLERKRLSINTPFPLLESEDDGWKRMVQWLESQIRFAVTQERKDASKLHHVLAFGHAGVFRVFLTRLIGRDVLFAHRDARFDADGRFSIPNTSLTVLDVHVESGKDEPGNDTEEGDWMTRIKKVDVVLLTCTEHYNALTS